MNMVAITRMMADWGHVLGRQPRARMAGHRDALRECAGFGRRVRPCAGQALPHAAACARQWLVRAHTEPVSAYKLASK